MNADPALRFTEAGKIADEVLRFLDGEPVLSYRENLFEVMGRWLARNRVVVTLVIAYLVMRVIVFFWFRL